MITGNTICWWEDPEGIPEEDKALLQRARKSNSYVAYKLMSEAKTEACRKTLDAISSHLYHCGECEAGIL